MTLAARLFALVAFLCAASAPAQDYPSKPIRVLVPYAAGGADLYIRPLQASLAKSLGQPLVIENMGGGGGMVGANVVRTSRPDGYTLCFCGTGALTTAPRLAASAPYTIDEFAPIANVIAIPFVLAMRRDLPYATFAEFLAFARANPAKISYGTPGDGSAPHLAAEAMAAVAGIRLLHVPYQGIVPAVHAALGGHIDGVMGAPSVVMPQVRDGKLVALAVTSPERFAPMKEVMTLREGGVDSQYVTRFGFFAPRGTPEPVVRKLAAALAESVNDAAYVEAMRRIYNDVVFIEPAAYAVSLAAEDRDYARLIRDLRIKAQ